jgi:hypothetical protein
VPTVTIITPPQHLISGTSLTTSGGSASRLSYHFEQAYVSWVVDTVEQEHDGSFATFKWDSPPYFSTSLIPVFMTGGNLVVVNHLKQNHMENVAVPVTLSAKASHQAELAELNKLRLVQIIRAVISHVS